VSTILIGRAGGFTYVNGRTAKLLVTWLVATEIAVNDVPTTVHCPLVLLAEDEAIIALELADSLNAAGFDVAGPFPTCAAAEEWLKTGEPDAAILDNLLKDGPCDALARDLSHRGVPLIMFSGHDQRQSEPADWKATWVTKPVAFPTLLDALSREMHEAQQRQAQV
jgi:DNA-binding response OmpR family regulator